MMSHVVIGNGEKIHPIGITLYHKKHPHFVLGNRSLFSVRVNIDCLVDDHPQDYSRIVCQPRQKKTA